eukprot:CAMPEP_0176415388 /NCGR_PEP_ID=MMETSP0127-20121128/5781_1 /TAXON_ID=938130 /ORGANISM="Platyophrya macrostoma, Strain WH" /LENGTH=460 /DNA_ID=CAMNT_0017795383 /DNA_START=92 /DNA_END=1474 /DNA_ORIENTATION=+
MSKANITEVYDFGKVIGSGDFGTVKLASLKGTNSPLFAVKSIPREKVKEDTKLLQRELELLRDIDHPNIVKFYEVYEDDEGLHFVMEYCSGGQVMEKFVKENRFGEAEAAKIMGKAFSAVKYLHEHGIVHRDIKPENFLYTSDQPDAEIKLIDFGLSRFTEPHQLLSSKVGTPYYVSPDVINGSYDYRCDNWSLGVMMYVLLTGYYPFDAKNTLQLGNEILYNSPKFTGEQWKNISSSARDLVEGLLIKDPYKRTTAKKALSHSWVKRTLKSHRMEHSKAENIWEHIRHFSLEKKLKKEALSVLITHIRDGELKELREAFKYFDKHNTGEISIADLKRVSKEQSLKIKKSELNEIMKSIHLDDSHTISFSEFLFIMLDTSVYLTREMLMRVFSHFDVDHSGYITAENLKEAMARSAKHVSDQEIQQMMAETRYSSHGKISFEDFYTMMKPEEPAKKAIMV